MNRFPAENCDIICGADVQANAYEYLENNSKMHKLNTTSSKMKFSG